MAMYMMILQATKMSLATRVLTIYLAQGQADSRQECAGRVGPVGSIVADGACPGGELLSSNCGRDSKNKVSFCGRTDSRNRPPPAGVPMATGVQH